MQLENWAGEGTGTIKEASEKRLITYTFIIISKKMKILVFSTDLNIDRKNSSDVF